jgi:integrase
MELWQAVYLMLACILGGGIWALPITEWRLSSRINVPVTISEQRKTVPMLHFRDNLPLDGNIALAQSGARQREKNSSQHTLGHLACPACEGRKQKAMQVNLSPGSRFCEAARQWKESRQDQLSEGSLRNYGDYLKALNSFFGEMTLEQIHIGHVEEYQDLRKATCGPSRLNHEISTLQQILKRAGLWEEIKKYYEPMRLPESGPGIALEPDEEEWLFKTAAKKPKWKIAYCCALLSANTTMGPKEIKCLRLGDVDPSRRVVSIREGVKTKFRIRSIPLNEDALWAMNQLIEIGHQHGSYLPEHYILTHRPHVAKAAYNPYKPMGSWKTAWKSLRKEAGKKFPRLATLQRYSLRHHAATKLLENPFISERTIEDMMGHRLNSKTKERYSHIRMQRKWEAVTALSRHHAQPQLPPKQSVKPATSTVDFLFKNKA